MTWLDRPGAFESQINRNALHFRSARLDAVVAAMKEAERDASDANLWEVAPALYKWRESDPNEFSARFGEQRYNELMKELLEARRKKKFGIPLVIDPGSHPGYEPGLWNDGGMVQTSTNCYAYACNDREGHRPAVFELDAFDRFVPTEIHTPQPGHLGAHFGLTGTSGPTGTAQQRRRIERGVQASLARGEAGFTGPGVRYQVLQDDRARRAKLAPFLLGKGEDPVNVPGYYLIALVVCGEDYHWLRQDDNSYWSHKPGISKVKDVDDANKFIWDPRHATYRNIPYRFECFYQVPKGGVKTWSLGDL
ncbi:MAG TPA: hypothetical protein VH539_07110 [Gemmatimonadaceae bacterium]|jgi:hypothetical protein